MCLLLATVALAMSCACYRRYVEASTEAGDCTVTIREAVHGADSSLRATCKTARFDKVIFDEPSDRIPGVAEFALNDETLSVLVCDGLSKHIFVTIDLRNGEPLLFNAAAIKTPLMSRYALSERDLSPFAGNAIEWACLGKSDATSRFLELVGEKRVLTPIRTR